jgi:hypothetical protein
VGTLTLTPWHRRHPERQPRPTRDARAYPRGLAALAVAQREPVGAVARRLRVTPRRQRQRLSYPWKRSRDALGPGPELGGKTRGILRQIRGVAGRSGRPGRGRDGPAAGPPVAGRLASSGPPRRSSSAGGTAGVWPSGG